MRNFLRPFRGVSKWYESEIRWYHNMKEITNEVLRVLLGLSRAPISLLEPRQFTLPPGPGLAVSPGLVVDADEVDDHFRGERGGPIGVAEELAPDGHVHDEEERPVERGRPGVEVPLPGRVGPLAGGRLAA